VLEAACGGSQALLPALALTLRRHGRALPASARAAALQPLWACVAASLAGERLPGPLVAVGTVWALRCLRELAALAIAELVDMDVAYVGARVVQHDYKTRHPVKYLGNKNEDYPRKNWSSVILWHCGFMPNRVLTPDFVARKPGSYLHRFSWLPDHQIGQLPREWNRLVLEEPMTSGDKLRHYTIGTPCFDEYSASDPEWWTVYDRMKAPA
jgi:hypothetical protein